MKCKVVFIAICTIFIFSSTSVFSQDFYLGDTLYKYTVGIQEPPIDWKNLSFDDAFWDTGYSNIGYGNISDSVLVDTTTSIYIRKKFTISDLQPVTKLNLIADFDDGYIAYINGVEVIRVNLGDSGTVVPYNGLATRSREMLQDRQTCKPLLGYYIDSTLLKKCLVQGENVIAIQVHNDSLKGSDIGFGFALFNISNQQYNPYWFQFAAVKQVKVDSTHLPIVKIFTGENGIDNCSKKVEATMQIISSESNMYNYYNDLPNVFTGNIGIEPRGQSSLDFPKKNYSVELRDDNGNDTSFSLLGMPKENDWILHGPFADRSQIRNALAYDLARKTGQYAPRTRFCEVFINDEYLGIYVLMEQIKRDDNRVNVQKLTPINKVNVTGGYIIKFDKDVNGNFGIVYPDEKDITQVQINYITDFFLKYYASLHDSVILNPDRGYRKYVDVPSYLDFTIVNELVRNPDAYLFSTYMYKDNDDYDTKLHFGPVWDFDLSFSNSNFQNAKSSIGWQFAQSTNYKLYHKKMFKDTLLVDQFNERWFQLRSGTYSNDSLLFTIDSLLNILGPAIDRNKDVWQLENDYIMGAAWGQNISLTYDEDIALLKKWIIDRATWMDQNIGKIYYPYTYKPVSIENINPLKESILVYPNPTSDYINVKYNLEKPSEISVALSDLNGNQISKTNTDLINQGEYMQSFFVRNLPNGLYFVTVYENNVIVSVQKVVKK